MAARQRLCVIAASFIIWGLSACSQGPMEIGGPKSYSTLRYSTTVRQALDFTCAGAALATMLTHYWGRPTTEAEILTIFRARYPMASVWKSKLQDGFTFDDIAFAAEVLGYEAAGAKISVDELASLNGPVIVHLDKGSFQHFVVLRKAHDGVFYTSDPIVGQVGLQRPEFERQYTGNAMAVWREGRALPTGAPLALVRDGMSVSRSLRGSTMPTLFDPNNIK